MPEISQAQMNSSNSQDVPAVTYHICDRIFNASIISHVTHKHKMTALQRWAKDNIKINFLENLGYKVLIIWESDRKSNPEQVLKDIINVAD